jgi:multidrug efflux pump subunit AcrA (membrane-fusion protein)
VVPDDAVQYDDRSRTHVVFLAESETVFQPRRVEVGVRLDGFTEVRGVRAGERVAAKGSHALKSEMLKDRISSED